MEMNLFAAIFQYEYLQNAYVAGLLIAFISPIFGMFVVAKKVSLLPDTIGHVTFAATTLTAFLMSVGLVSTLMSPTPIVLLLVVTMALLISTIIQKSRNNQDVALSFVMTFSLGLAIVLQQLSTYKTDLSTYLFGNIVTLTRIDIVYIIGITFIALLFIVVFYKKMLLATFDPIFAKTRGYHFENLDRIFFVLLALIIAASTKFVGVLLVSALMNLPVMIATSFTQSFKQGLIVSVILSEVMMIIGLITSYYLDLPTSGVVAILLGVVFLSVLFIRRLPRFIK
jgi:zinc transport system permease protein